MKIQSSTGFTLVELVIASTMTAFLFLMITTVFVQSLRSLQGETNSADVDSLIAMETLTRMISVAHEATLDAPNNQLSLRVDNNTPGTISAADDTWVSYRFIAGTLRRSQDDPPNAVAPNVVAGDTEVVPGLNALNGAGQSTFTLVNPTGIGSANVVQVRLVTQENPNEAPRVFVSNVAMRSSK